LRRFRRTVRRKLRGSASGRTRRRFSRRGWNRPGTASNNASAQRSSFDQIVIKPPSGLAVKIALPIDMPPRTTTSFITIVAPFTGKALPAGSYAVQALYHGVTIASGSGDIL